MKAMQTARIKARHVDQNECTSKRRFKIASSAISLQNISKNFGAVRANKDVSLSVRPGTIHGIVGENGAGKSTLVSILYGFYTADSGQVSIAGQPVKLRSSVDAIAAGIGMVHQHFMLVPNFTVLENIILGHEGGFNLEAGQQQAEASLREIAERYGLSVDLSAVVQDLPVGLQQRVEILKALYRGPVLILDEPTGVLTPQETEQLFDILRTSAAGGDDFADHAQAEGNYGGDRFCVCDARWRDG